MKCGICKKDMSDSTQSIIALSISFENLTDNHDYDELLKKQFGKFDPEQKYMCCYECWLTSLGFRPTKRDRQ